MGLGSHSSGTTSPTILNYNGYIMMGKNVVRMQETRSIRYNKKIFQKTKTWTGPVPVAARSKA